MTPQAIEIHMIMMLMIITQFIFLLIITGMSLTMYFDIKAIRNKLRLMGFRLAGTKEIEELNERHIDN
jgi:hypothetical protein